MYAIRSYYDVPLVALLRDLEIELMLSVVPSAKSLITLPLTKGTTPYRAVAILSVTVNLSPVNASTPVIASEKSLASPITGIAPTPVDAVLFPKVIT